MYFLNIFPLEEQYLNNAKTDELIVDPRTGHITICKKEGSEFVSLSKDLEAELNGLLSLKDRFYKEYLEISETLEEIIRKTTESKDNINDIINSINEIRNKLTEINGYANKLLAQFNMQYKAYNKYLYNTLLPIRNLLAENTKKVVIIENTLDELLLLSNDIETMRAINKEYLIDVIEMIGMTEALESLKKGESGEDTKDDNSEEQGGNV